MCIFTILHKKKHEKITKRQAGRRQIEQISTFSITQKKAIN